MAGSYPDKIKTLPLYDGRFDAYKLEAKDSDVLFASYPAGTSIVTVHPPSKFSQRISSKSIALTHVSGLN